MYWYQEQKIIAIKVMNAVSDALILIDETARIILCNNAAEQLFGYRLSEIEKQKIEILIPFEQRAIHVTERLKYMENPYENVMDKRKILQGLHKSGEIIQLKIQLTPMQVRDDGTYILVTMKPIKE